MLDKLSPQFDGLADFHCAIVWSPLATGSHVEEALSPPCDWAKTFSPKASNHSLYLTKPLRPSYPEGNFGGNQLLDDSISLSPLYPYMTNDLHVSIIASFHQGFP